MCCIKHLNHGHQYMTYMYIIFFRINLHRGYLGYLQDFIPWEWQEWGPSPSLECLWCWGPASLGRPVQSCLPLGTTTTISNCTQAAWKWILHRLQIDTAQHRQYQYLILPRLLQRSKESRGHYSTLYHATSQWIMRSDTHLFFWHNEKKSVYLKFKIMSITVM